MVTFSEAIITGHVSTAETLAIFDQAQAVNINELTGVWHGWELATSHPMDGSLAHSG